VIELLHATDPAYIDEAAKRGVFAYIVDGDSESLAAHSQSHSAASPSTRTSKARSAAGQ
jgi:hypothetical protein